MDISSNRLHNKLFTLINTRQINCYKKTKLLKSVKNVRGHPGSNRGPLDLQSNALPLSYIPMTLHGLKIMYKMYTRNYVQ